MASRLIINADDFGLTPGINRAIAELHHAGVLTSATLMATGPAFDHAVVLADTLPTLGVGCHIVLVDGIPVSPPHEISTLLDPNDPTRFRSTLGSFVRDLLQNRINPAQIAHEARAQIAKVQRAGIDITHADTHKHTHLFPAVARALLSLPEITALRNPFEPAATRRISRAPLQRRLQLALLNRLHPVFTRLTVRIPTTDGTLGIAATGTLTPATLHRLLRTLPPDGTYELCCHPGYTDPELDRIPTRLRTHRDIERQALLTEIPRMLASPSHPQLIHYGKLK